MPYLLLILALVGIDQLVKWIVSSQMVLNSSLPVLGIIKITYIQNTGAAFGILEGGRILFVAITLALIVAALLLRKKPGMKRYYLPASLIIAGALGNCIDRVFRNYVVDYIDFTVWPVFNIADIAVCCGAALLVLLVITDKSDKSDKFDKSDKPDKSEKSDNKDKSKKSGKAGNKV